MDKKEKYYKEIIKSRMFKNAANIWGVRNIDNFDPLIKLLIEALASEMNKLSYELNNIETRLLERLAAMLTPDILMRDHPSHMLLHSLPLENKATIHKTSGFFYEGINKNLVFNFYPADTFSLINGRVKSIICGRSIYRIDENLVKELQSRSIKRSEKFTHSIWVGLDIDSSLKTVKNLSFYFDILNIENKNELFHLLPYTQWVCEGEILNTSQGIHLAKNGNESELKPFDSYELSNVSDSSIIKNYNQQFITVTSPIVNSPSARKCIPDGLAELFPAEVTTEEAEKLLWIKISFPPNYEEYILDNFFVALNVFPVVNKKLRSKYFKTTSNITSVIPLEIESGEYFLSMNSVVDTHNKEYQPLPYQDIENNNRYGTYIVKKGGVERFDPRNAKEYISYLIDLLREEGAAFSMIGKGFVDELVGKMEELIASIEKKLEEINANKDISSYLIIDADEVGDTIFLDYWITNCEGANDIKAGAFLFPFNETYVNPDTVISLTQSKGGRRIQKNQSLDIYKYILTSHNRIYTDEDIINFCFAEFGDILSAASVKKGVQISNRPKEGLIRSIDVFIELKQQITQFSSEQDILNNLLAQLKERSPESYNYRIFITKS